METKEVNLDAITQYKLILPQTMDYDDRYKHQDCFSKKETILDLYKFLTVARAFIFVNSKNTAEDVCEFMKRSKFSVDCIHGDMDNKTRTEKLSLLSKGDITALICTNVAGRGIDIQHANLVINYDMCKEVADYVHRVGRCGRYGRKGLAISFISIPDDPRILRRGDLSDTKLLEKIENELQITIKDLPDPKYLANW